MESAYLCQGTKKKLGYILKKDLQELLHLYHFLWEKWLGYFGACIYALFLPVQQQCKYVTRVVECIYPAVEVSASERMTLLLHLILGKERDVSLIIAAFQVENWH